MTHAVLVLLTRQVTRLHCFSDLTVIDSCANLEVCLSALLKLGLQVSLSIQPDMLSVCNLAFRSELWKGLQEDGCSGNILQYVSMFALYMIMTELIIPCTSSRAYIH